MHGYYTFVFLSDLSVWSGQQDWFILQWERCFVMGSILWCSILVTTLSIYHSKTWSLQITVEEIDKPLGCVGCKYLLLCVQILLTSFCSPTGLITLVLNWGKYLSLLYCIILSSSGKSQLSSQVAHSSGFNLMVIYIPVTEWGEGTWCVVAAKDKTTKIDLIARFVSVYVMSSFLLWYSVFH